MFLIAESKTMSADCHEIESGVYKAHQPVYESYADEIMQRLRELPVDRLAEATGLSLNLSRSLSRMAYEFPNKSTGLRAIESFTGVVFRQLHPAGYDAVQSSWLSDNVRIISSVYGWLRPDDIIKPYRLEFKNKVAPGGDALVKFWRKHVTIALVRELKEKNDTAIFNLLPSDASKCIDWKLVKRFAKVYHIDFKIPTGGDTLKTPNSGRLKQLRGRILDLAITRGISTPEAIAAIESDDFIPQGELIYPGTFTYFTD